jgi:hypothetical protein
MSRLPEPKEHIRFFAATAVAEVVMVLVQQWALVKHWEPRAQRNSGQPQMSQSAAPNGSACKQRYQRMKPTESSGGSDPATMHNEDGAASKRQNSYQFSVLPSCPLLPRSPIFASPLEHLDQGCSVPSSAHYFGVQLWVTVARHSSFAECLD